MIALAFFADIFLIATVVILLVRGAKAPGGYQPLPSTKLPPPPMPRVRPARNLFAELCEGMSALREMREATERDAVLDNDDRMRSLSVRTPERDADFWDIANHEPEASRVEYRFLDIPYEDEA